MRFSRRARRLATLGVLGVLAVALVVTRRLERLAPETAPAGARLALAVLSPGIRVLSAVDRRVSAFLDGVLELVTAHRRAAQLEVENAALRREIGALRMAMRRVGRWPALVAAAETLSLPTVAAEVLGRGPLPRDPVLWIDAGEAEGVAIGQPVIAPAGLAGRVIQTSAHESHVRLIVAQNTAVTALLGSAEHPGMVRGLGRDHRLEFIAQDQGLEITLGERVVTAGLEGSLYFPTGLLIGEVSEIGTTSRGLRRASVRPAVDFRRLDDVLVLMAPPPRLRPLEGRRLLGPHAAPAEMVAEAISPEAAAAPSVLDLVAQPPSPEAEAP